MAKPFEKILCTTDLDDASLGALDQAIDLARQSGGRITLLHVVPEDEGHLLRDVYRPQEGGGANPDWAHEVAEKRLAEIARDRIGDQVPHETLVLRGDPEDVILEQGKSLDADLIAISTHGRKGVPHLFLGSVAEKVVRGAPCPVLTVRWS